MQSGRGQQEDPAFALAMLALTRPIPASPQGLIVPFSFATPSPLVLAAIVPGQTLTRAAMQIDTPFNDPAARVELGTSLVPGLVFSSTDVSTGVAGQYENRILTTFISVDLLLLTIAPGASTQGSGIIFYAIQ